MAREGKAYLTELVESVICVPDAFRIRCGNDNFIFSIQSKNQETNDYFAISAIYDTICTIDSAIKFAFAEAIAIDLPESLDTYNPFSQIGEDERIAIYHVENIVFRVSILWDMRVGQQWYLTSFRIKYRIIKGEKLDGSDTSFSLLPLFSLRLYLLLMWRILKVSCSGRSSLEMHSTTLWGSLLLLASRITEPFVNISVRSQSF